MPANACPKFKFNPSESTMPVFEKKIDNVFLKEKL